MCSTIAQPENHIRYSEEISLSICEMLLAKKNQKVVDPLALQSQAQRLLNFEIHSFSDHLLFARLLFAMSVFYDRVNKSVLEELFAKHNDAPFITTSIVRLYDAAIRFFMNKNQILEAEETSFKQEFIERFFQYKEQNLLCAIEEILLLHFLSKQLLHLPYERLSRQLAALFSPLIDQNLFSLYFGLIPQTEYKEQENHTLLALFFAQFFPQKEPPFSFYEIKPHLLVFNHFFSPSSAALTSDDLCMDYTVINAPPFFAFYTPFGRNTPMGALQKGAIKIKAFGPQYKPLDEPASFGIFHLRENALAAPSKQWSRSCIKEENRPTFALDWHLVNIVSSSSLQLSVESKIFSDQPLFFSFFVSADCLIVDHKKKILPKELSYFRGECKQVLLEKGGGTLSLNTEKSRFVEIIPLAGGDYFWGCDYLIAYQLNNVNKNFNCTIY